MSTPVVAIKIDVDTERGTRIGVPNMLQLFEELQIPATFLFSLGPDNTGRAIKRIFRPGFLQKVTRTSVISTYGLKTLLNGILLPGPHIAKKHAAIMRLVREKGHETGIHCYDHIRWQDGLKDMTQAEVFIEFSKARQEYFNVFNEPAQSAGAAGWQADANSLAAYDDAGLLYGSDARGLYPFYPKVGDQIFKTLQIPSNLPTLDELIGLPEYPEGALADYYLGLLRTDYSNIFTTHAEIEGMAKLAWFREFLTKALAQGVQFCTLATVAQSALANKAAIPVCEFIQDSVPGRSGLLAVQQVTSVKVTKKDSPLQTV